MKTTGFKQEGEMKFEEKLKGYFMGECPSGPTYSRAAHERALKMAPAVFGEGKPPKGDSADLCRSAAQVVYCAAGTERESERTRNIRSLLSFTKNRDTKRAMWLLGVDPGSRVQEFC